MKDIRVYRSYEQGVPAENRSGRYHRNQATVAANIIPLVPSAMARAKTVRAKRFMFLSPMGQAPSGAAAVLDIY